MLEKRDTVVVVFLKRNPRRTSELHHLVQVQLLGAVESSQMQCWSEVRLGLMALGYRRILHIDIVCVACGTWRGAVHEEKDIYPCPQCQAACSLAHVVEGFSRHELPPWELRRKPLSPFLRRVIMSETFGEYRGAMLENEQRRQHASKFTDKAFKRGRGLRGAVDLR